MYNKILYGKYKVVRCIEEVILYNKLISGSGPVGVVYAITYKIFEISK